MILIDDTYIVQGKPKMMADGYRLIGHEDIHSTGDLDEAYFEMKKAEQSGNYQDVRVVKTLSLEVVES